MVHYLKIFIACLVNGTVSKWIIRITCQHSLVNSRQVTRIQRKNFLIGPSIVRGIVIFARRQIAVVLQVSRHGLTNINEMGVNRMFRYFVLSESGITICGPFKHYESALKICRNYYNFWLYGKTYVKGMKI